MTQPIRNMLHDFDNMEEVLKFESSKVGQQRDRQAVHQVTQAHDPLCERRRIHLKYCLLL
jgi:hypothetical protein